MGNDEYANNTYIVYTRYEMKNVVKFNMLPVLRSI